MSSTGWLVLRVQSRSMWRKIEAIALVDQNTFISNKIGLDPKKFTDGLMCDEFIMCCLMYCMLYNNYDMMVVLGQIHSFITSRGVSADFSDKGTMKKYSVYHSIPPKNPLSINNASSITFSSPNFCFVNSNYFP